MLSKNGIGLIIFVAAYFGIALTEVQLVEVTAAVAQIVSFILLAWNQMTRPDVVGFFFKK